MFGCFHRWCSWSRLIAYLSKTYQARRCLKCGKCEVRQLTINASLVDEINSSFGMKESK